MRLDLFGVTGFIGIETESPTIFQMVLRREYGGNSFFGPDSAGISG